MIARETTTEQRVLLLADLKDMSERTGTIEAEIYALIEERTTAEQQLASYQTVLVDSGHQRGAAARAPGAAINLLLDKDQIIVLAR